MSHLNKFREMHTKLIEKAGGLVSDGLFVTRTGVMITKKSQVTNEAKELFNILNLDTSLSDAEQHSEFNAKLTYMAFPHEKISSEEYNRKMIHEYGHRSVYNDEVVTFLIAGCGVETLAEFLAHNEGTVSRLTSSKTKAQDQPLYKVKTHDVSDKVIDSQKNLIKDHIAIKENYSNSGEFDSDNELFNILTLGNKVVSFTITMSLKDWHKTFIGRLSHHGVEKELLEILEDVLEKLAKDYHFFFNSKDEYYEMNNSEKYKN